MFMIGLEVNVRELLKMGRVAVFAGIAGAVLPVVIALPITMLFDYEWQPSLFGRCDTRCNFSQYFGTSFA